MGSLQLNLPLKVSKINHGVNLARISQIISVSFSSIFSIFCEFKLNFSDYGFNEETWRAYCERQKRMRIHESGVGLASLTAAQQGAGPPGQGNEMGGPIMSAGGPRPGINIGFKRMMGGPRPPRQLGIDVIGAPSQNPIRAPAPRENVIQVMTADRREYSRTVVNQSNLPLGFNVPPEEFYNHEEQDAFNYGYEPTQDSQWSQNQSNNPNWAPGEIKELTPMNQPPPMGMGMNMNIPPPHMGVGAPRMPMMNPQMIQPLMGGQPMNIKQEPEDKRDMRGSRMGYRDVRDDRRYDNDRKRRERSSSRDRKYDRTRDDRDRSRGDRYARDANRRRSKSRDRKRSRSRSRDKSKRSKSKDRKGDDKDGRSSSRRTDDKSKRSSIKEEKV
jgi:pre-mRNA 3'-end-processing factor FIP1